MRGKLFDIEQGQPMRGKYPLNGQKREIGEVLVIDRIELIVLHQFHEVRELHRNDPAWLQENLHAPDEVVQIRDMSQHIIPQKEICAFPRRRKLSGSRSSEKLYHCGNAFLHRYL